MNRRKFIRIMGMAGAAAIVPWRLDLKEGWQAGAAYAAVNSRSLGMWRTTLRAANAASLVAGDIPVAASDGLTAAPPCAVAGVKHYTIDIQEFQDQLHPNFVNPTTLWGYNPTLRLGGAGAVTQKHLGGIIVANKNEPFQITFRNKLPTAVPPGRSRLHIIPVDTSVLGANQAQNRTAVHMHGGLVDWTSDGGPFDWFDPLGNHGSSFLNNQVLKPGGALPGEAEYYYGMNQSARMLWYHDHAWGITRLNAYAGIASGVLLRDTFEANLRGQGLPDFIENGGREIPLVIQDKIFVPPNIKTLDPTWTGPRTPGSLWYSHIYDPKLYKRKIIGSIGPLPKPSCIPEFFGDTMLVNGTVYPQVTLEARRYRLRILNACSSRFLNLQLYVGNGTAEGITLDPVTMTPTNAKGPDFLLLGTEGGFLPNPVTINSGTPFNLLTLQGSLIQGPAERADLIVDFSGFANQSLILYNDAPAPFPGGAPIFDYFPGNPLNPINPTPGAGPNTRNILRINVVPATLPADPPLGITPATDLTAGNDPLLTTINPGLGVNADGSVNIPAGASINVRQLTLNEAFDAYGRLMQLIGTNVAPVRPRLGFGRGYIDPATEIIANNTVEVWQIANLSADTHPLHFHLVNVQVLARQPFNVATYTGVPTYLGPPRPPDPDETGWKETVRMHPGEVITVAMHVLLPTMPFAVPGSPRTVGPTGADVGDLGLKVTFPAGFTTAHEYVWHCHILEHEEHDMMRPFVVVT